MMMNSAFLDDISLEKPEFDFQQQNIVVSESRTTKQQQQRFCWCMPVAISFLLMILLGVTSVVVGAAEIKKQSTPPAPILLLPRGESTIETCESMILASREQGIIAHGEENSLQIWMSNIVKPILIEVGALALFQSMGALPILTKLFLSSRRSSNLLRLVATKKVATRLLRVKWRSPRMMRRIHESAKRMYRSRSRLSAAGDITHVIGDDTEQTNQTKPKTQDNTIMAIP